MLKGKIKRLSVASAGIAILIAAAGRAPAEIVLFDSHGFESSAGYSTAGNGNLVGQPAAGPVSGQWSETGPGTLANSPYPFAGVINYPASTQQLVGIQDTNIGNADYGYWLPNTYAQPNTPFTPSVGGATNDVLVRWTEAYTPVVGGNNPFFGVQVFSGTTSVALAGIDANSNQLVDGNSDEFGFSFLPNTYYNFLLDLNYQAQTYSIYLETNVSTTLIDSRPFDNAATTFTDADLLTYVLGSSGVGNGTGYFDNYRVTAVPEPATLSLAVAASTLLLTRRRSKKTFSNGR